MKEKYYILEKHFGNHSQAARFIGMSPRNYRNIRSGKHRPSQVVQNLIENIVESILDNPSLKLVK